MSMSVPVSAGESAGASVAPAHRRRHFWQKTRAVLAKEFIQLRRDRMSFGMIIMIPLMQLMLFGYAINTNPRHLPTAVLLQEQSDVGRSILHAIVNTKYFDVTHVIDNEREFDRLLQSGAVLFGIEIPVNFERAVRRGDRPALLVAADATDPVGSASAMASLSTVVKTALEHDRLGVVEEPLARDATERDCRPHQRATQRVHRQVEDEFAPHRARVRQHQDEEPQRARPARAFDLADVGPIDLRLLT